MGYRAAKWAAQPHCASRKFRNTLLIGASALVLSACADIPPEFRIDDGAQPRYEDETVRFRTTYYFRVFDLCDGYGDRGTGTPKEVNLDVRFDDPVFYRKNRGEALTLEKDSLYRFTMTGKASAITNKIHFESGTLKSWQIDPFGASVEYDPDSGRFFFQSQEATQKEAERNKLFREVNRLVALRNSAEMKDFDADVKALISAAIKDLGGTSADGFAASTLSDSSGRLISEASTLSAKKAIDKVQEALAELETQEIDAPELPNDAAARPDGTGFAIPAPRTDWSTVGQDEIGPILTGLEGELEAAGDVGKSMVEQSVALVTDLTARIKKSVADEVQAAMSEVSTTKGNLENASQALDALESRYQGFDETIKTYSPLIDADKSTLATRSATLATAQNRLSTATTNKTTADGRVSSLKQSYDQAVTTLTDEQEKQKKLPDTATDQVRTAADDAVKAAEDSVATVKSNYDAALQQQKTREEELDLATRTATDAATLCKEVDTRLDGRYSLVLSAARRHDVIWEDLSPPQMCDGTARPPQSTRDPANHPNRLEMSALNDAIAAARLVIAGDGSAVTGLEPELRAAENELSQKKGVEISVGEKTAEALALAKMAQEVRRPAAEGDKLCGPGSEGRRGFQVMGPEGVRTFDQDERLLMAMSSSASPLVDVLKEVSSRVLDRRVTQSEPLLPYAQERVSILGAQRTLDNLKLQTKPAADTEGALQKIVDAFSRPGDAGVTP